MTQTVYTPAEGQRFAADTMLTVVCCYTCKMTYAIPESLYRSAQRYPGGSANGWKLTCPLGHQWWYTGDSVDDKLAREKDRSARLVAERDQAQASASAHKAAATRARNERDRVRKRAAHGVCPCCGRTFKQVARHMRSQHPDFVADPSK